MPLRMKTVAGIGFALVIGGCATPQPVVAPSQAADRKTLTATAAQLTNGPGTADAAYSIGPAIVDTVGGYLPDGQTLTPFDVDNPLIAWLDPTLLAAVQQAARAASADGVDVEITSGWRTRGFQQRLFDDAILTYGSADTAGQFVASPDTSSHVVGKAVDVGPAEADNWLIRNGSRFGLCQIFANEIWHFELTADEDGNCPPLRPNAAG